MAQSRDVAVLVGSLRKGSYNRMMANAIVELAPTSLRLAIVEIGQLSLYNEDADGPNAPAEWLAFRDRIRRSDAVLLVSPEYNRSIPGVLKNALDVASRPYGESVWQGKPGAVISVSPSELGGFGANHHLRQTFVFLDIRAMQQPEAYIGGGASLFDEHGKLINERTREFVRQFVESFAAWIELQLHY